MSVSWDVREFTYYEEVSSKNMVIKKMKEQYEALCDCLLFQLDHPAKISGTEYLNLAFMNGISGTGMALMEIL